jgi:membrane-associated phospholipid phosphatase
MIRVLLALSLCARVAAADPAPPAVSADPRFQVVTPERHRVLRGVLLIASAGLYLTSETVAKDALIPSACRWCSPNGLDDAVHGALTWGDARRAGILSDVTGFALVPVAAAGLLALASHERGERWLGYGDDLLALGESLVYSQLVIQVIKLTTGRARPYAHYATPDRIHTNDDNLSFASGHSALTFAIAATAGAIAHRRHDRLEPVIWATGLTLAATTAYLRIAAEQHYLTDVLAGGAIGAGLGLAIPRITGALPAEIQLVPTGSGVALSGAF